MCQLTKKTVKLENGKTYQNIVVLWEHDGHTFHVRVKPVFMTDWKKLIAHAEEVD